jgi:hypothetical protein
MPNCPKCNEDIDHLDFVSKETHYGEFTSEGDYEENDNIDVDDIFYRCPECNNDLFTDYDDANEFFHPKDITRW